MLGALVLGLVFYSPSQQPRVAMPSTGHSAVDGRVVVEPGGKATARINRLLPWTQVARVASSCDCATLTPVQQGTDGPAILSVDLSAYPQAKDFAPVIELFDSSSRLLARITVDVVVVTMPRTK